MNKENQRFLDKLRAANLTKQQYKTLKGQALSGQLEAAERGLMKLKRKCPARLHAP